MTKAGLGVAAQTISGAIAAEVIARGAITYGLMGNGNAYFLDALIRGGGRFVGVRHESAAVAAADTAWRVGRRLAVATVTYGAGFTNTLTALAEATMHRSPLVVVAGDQPSTGARPWDVDQASMITSAGAHFITVGHTSVAADTARAFAVAEGQRVPVVLLLPYDLATVEVPTTDTRARHAGSSPASPPPAATAIEPPPRVGESEPNVLDVAALLAGAARPLILAGDGARDAREDLVTLADMLDALTATTAIAKGTFAGREGDLGVCGGFASPDSATLIREADVVLVVGAGLNQFTMAFGHSFGPDARVVQVDRRGGPTHPRVTDFVGGDASDVVRALLTSVPESRHEEWRSRGSQCEGHHRGDDAASDGLLDPRSLFARLDTLLPSHRLVVQDGGHFSGWAPMFWQMSHPGRFHMVGTAFQTIGLGLAAALGAATTRPNDLTVLVAGDGGFLMSLADLESVIREARHCLIVVVNDGAYGAEVHQYGARGVHREPMHVGSVNFAGVARGLGAEAITVNNLGDLEALDRWLDAGANQTMVLDCKVSPNVVAPYMDEIVAVAAAAETAHRERFASR